MDPDAMEIDTPPPEPPYNPYASLPSARQTNEPIAAFLQRLPPASNAARLICVYTKDFTDVADVRRVLLGLVEMGLVRADMPRGITYKCDAYTYLDIYGNNEFGLRASIYSSKEMGGGQGG